MASASVRPILRLPSTSAAVVLLCCWLLIGQASSQSIPRQNITWPERLYPGMMTYPNNEEFFNVMKTMTGKWVFPNEAAYPNASLVYNLRKMAAPIGIAYVESLEDVQKVMVFAKKHNLFVTIRSSGHSFIGRSAHDGSILIDLRKMKGRVFNPNLQRSPAGEMTVESGNSWLEVYSAVDEIVTNDGPGGQARGRVIIGGSAHTVGMGGYTMGGGHSPMCRKLGLAVDNLLEATMVLADGRKAVVNAQGTSLTDPGSNDTQHTNDASLFWALRGGGGGTWGVVTHFTFRVHFAPERFRRVGITWILNNPNIPVGTPTIKYVLQALGQLSEEWGGYLLVSGAPVSPQAVGSLTLFLNHFGNSSSPSNSEVTDLLNYKTTEQIWKNDTNFDTFLEYEKTAVDPSQTYSYIYNSFIHNQSLYDDQRLEQLTEFLMDLKNPPSPTSAHSCTGTLLGGQMAKVARDATPVNPKFRTGLLSMSCSLSWSDAVHRDSFYVQKALEMRNRLAPMGEGVYFNEPAEDQDDWQHQFWGDAATYQRLLSIKQTWDPDNFLWCHNCVGSDLKKARDPPPVCSGGPPPSVCSGVRGSKKNLSLVVVAAVAIVWLMLLAVF
ncbi:hypothetical protein ACOMHN_032322 [Nucella lapillus]